MVIMIVRFLNTFSLFIFISEPHLNFINLDFWTQIYNSDNIVVVASLFRFKDRADTENDLNMGHTIFMFIKII